MLSKLAIFCVSVWFSYYILRLLYIAKTKQYVMARTNSLFERVATPQTRADNPSKFWANVIVALVLSPVAVAGPLITGSELIAALPPLR